MYYTIPKTYSNDVKNNCKIMILILFVFDLLGIYIYIFQRARVLFFTTYLFVAFYMTFSKNFKDKIKEFYFYSFFIFYYFILKVLTGAGEIIPYTHI